MTRSVTAREAQLARVAWVIRGGIELAGVQVSEPTMQKLVIAVSDFMDAEGMFFDYQARIDREAEAIADSGAIGPDVDLPRTHPRRGPIE